MEITTQDEKKITQWAEKLSDNIQITLVLTEHEKNAELREFCDYLSDLAPKVSITREKDETGDIPAIRITKSLYYHAVPLGTELEPFLESLTIFNNESAQLPETIRDYAEKIKAPAELRVYVSQHCPFCPATVRQLLPLAVSGEFIRLRIIDGFLFHEMAESDNIQSAPTVLLDGQFLWTGSVDIKELLEMIVNRDPLKLSASSMESMLKQGNVSLLTKMMLDENAVFPAFLDLLVHEKWPVRLGAMVAMEEIAEKNKKLASTVVEPLWNRFLHAEDRVKGDILYILGEAGDHELIPRLEMISEGQYDAELKEAASEAIEKIKF